MNLMNLIPEEQRWVRGPDGSRHERRLVVDHDLPLQVDGLVTKVPQRPERDEETLERVAKAAKKEADELAFAASDEGKAKAAREARWIELLRPHAGFGRRDDGMAVPREPTLDGVTIFLASNFLQRAEQAEAKLAAARRPVEDAQREAAEARRALPIRASAGLPLTSTLEEIEAAQVRHEAAIQRVGALEERARLLAANIPPELAIEARRLRDRADAAVERWRRGQLRVPRPASDVFVWNRDVDGALLADLFHKTQDIVSVIHSSHGGLNLPSGSASPSLRALWNLAGLITTGRSFDDDDCVPQERDRGRWLVESQEFQRALSAQLRGALAFRFNLNVESGRARQRLDATWGPKPAHGSAVGERPM